MVFYPPSEATKKRHAALREAQRERRRADTIARLKASYLAEPDRAYAEELYGELLRELGEEAPK